jgi:NADPH2:quinone reductase
MRMVLVERFGGPEVLTWAEAEDPTPSTGEVVVDVKACGVGAADVMLRTGRHPLAPRAPVRPGNELAGVVSAVGEGVSENLLGARVALQTSIGGYAEKVKAPAEALVRLPESLAFDVACAIPVTVQTAHRMLVDAASLRAGQTVLIYGAAGSVGGAALAIAHRMGATTIAVASGDARVQRARDAGAHHVIDRSRISVADGVRQISGRGVDLILDPICGPEVNERLALLSPLGQLVLFGIMGGAAPDLFGGLLANFTRAVGVRAFSLVAFDLAQKVGRAQHLADEISGGAFQLPDPLRFPLREATAAHIALEAGRASRIVLLPEGS